LTDYLKIPEVARRLDVSEPTVRRMVKGGKLPSVFIGGAYRVSEKDLEEYLESAKVTPGKAPRRSPSEPSLLDGLDEERRTEADMVVHVESLDEVATGWLSEFFHGAEMRRVCVERLDDGSAFLRGYRA
jgi:excisionase family DNA binding protein